MEFNIFQQVLDELDHFFSERITVANAIGEDAGEDYTFNQWEMINTIDLYYNSRYKDGEFDAGGHQKIFLNTSAFRADVAAKQIDLDVKDFLFVPDNGHSEWGALFAQKDFKVWTKETYFGELLNDTVDRFPRYGTVVLKRVGRELHQVPLRTLRNPQDAQSLNDAEWVIEEHEMTRRQMSEMPDWDTEGMNMKLNEKEKVYLRYGYVPKWWFKEVNGEEADGGDMNEFVDVYIALTARRVKDKNTGKEKADGKILFMEEISRRPYEEAHWKRQDGRWLGIGEMETQMENQVAANMSANYRMKNMMWASRKFFQSPSDSLGRNMIKDVKDGDILEVNPNGFISPVDTATRATPDFNGVDQLIENNANQRSFTFEVATGESLPSGTPFRLGVVLSNSVNSHFGKKREQLGLFFKRVINELVIPEFKRNKRKEHILSIFADDEVFPELREIHINSEVNRIIKETVLEKGRMPNVARIRREVKNQLERNNFTFVKIRERLYDEFDFKVDLVITGESTDVEKRVETLTTLYQLLSQRQDPRAESVLRKLLSLSGESLANFKQREQTQPQGQQQEVGQEGRQALNRLGGPRGQGQNLRNEIAQAGNQTL